MENKNMNVTHVSGSLEEVLRSGISAEKLRADFETNLENAQRKIRIEQEAEELEAEKKAQLDDCRSELVAAIIDYMYWLDLTDTSYIEMPDEDIEELEQMIKDIEENLSSMKILFSLFGGEDLHPLLTGLKTEKHFPPFKCACQKNTDKQKPKNDADSVIRNWLKGL